MAVTVISRPLGYKLNTTPTEGRAGFNGADVLINSVAHGLTTGNYVYIESTIDSYNGFLYVNVFDVDNFKLQYSPVEFVPFIQEVYLTYYVSELEHGWQCVHLPIVYELASDLYPTNSVDTVITVAAYGFVNGYFAVTHTALTGADELFALDYVELSDGRIFQVVEIVSTTITVLNSDGTGTFGTMQKVRNNYYVSVEVYAGLPSGHPWESYKPYELAATLKFIPDDNNRVKFSIAEILKGYITTRNNLTLDTLPNNIDFFTSFYIQYAEGYDVSDGEVITAFLDEYTDDSEEFEGSAVNAMLAFKNVYSGFMSEYIGDDSVPGRWLTTMPRPIMWRNYFFDISLINTEDGFVIIRRSGDDYLTLTDPGKGILRIPVEPNEGDTEICLSAFANLIILSLGVNDGTVNTPWTLGTAPTVTTTTGNSQRILFDRPIDSIVLPYNLNVTVVGSEIVTVRFSLTDEAGTTDIDFVNVAFNSSGVKTGTVTLTGPGFRIGVKTFSTSGSGSRTVTINSLTEEIMLAEEICIEVVEECDDTLLADDLRLTETGPFRELE